MLVSVANTVKVELPAVLGVPEITPPVLRARPVGSEPTVTAYVYVPLPPAALIVSS